MALRGPPFDVGSRHLFSDIPIPKLTPGAADYVAYVACGVAVFAHLKIVLVTREDHLHAGAFKEIHPMAQRRIARSVRRSGREWRMVKIGNFPWRGGGRQRLLQPWPFR